MATIAALLVLVVHLLTLPAQGITDDDDFYASAGVRYAQWLGDVVTDPGRALTREGIDAAFVANHEHPPFAKLVFGLAHALLHDGLDVYGSLDAARAGNVLFAALLAFTMVLWTYRALGPLASLVGVLLWATLPRFFLHTEVATLDAPVATMIFVLTALWTWAGERRGRGVVVGVVFGLACLTKLNAPFAALTLTAFALLERWRSFRVEVATSPSSRPQLRLPWPPWSLVAMVLLGPVVFVVGWPWLWHDTAARLGGYVAFHLKHYPIYLFFDGEIWEQPFAPGRAAVVLGLGSMPLVVVALGLAGAAYAVGALARIARVADEDGTVSPAADRVAGLALLQGAVSLGVVALSDVPRYGGEKLFLPFFPFFCVLAGVGAARVVDAAGALAPRIAPRAVVAAVVVVLSALPGVVGSARFGGGFALSYYGELVGGLRGAVARGYERTYYDVADKELARLLARLPAGANGGPRVHFAPNHKEYVRTYRWLRHDGVVPRDSVTLVDQRAAADVVVLTHERRWATYPGLREELRGWAVLAEKRIDGVPLWTVLRRP
ncbi:MAG: glycosyltransferase family 39 protein [Deltaproteobacteria bacterium]|nr:glycosyltransferase family 39 protein [Deltaproteobacteria bacterium]